MSIIKLLHDTALDYYDQAKIHKIKGDLNSHDEYLKKHFY